MNKRILILSAALFVINQACVPPEMPEFEKILIEITSPSNGQTLEVDTAIEIITHSESEIVRVTLIIDEDTLLTIPLKEYEFLWNISYWADGRSHEIRIIGEDAHGVVGLAAPIRVTVPTSAAEPVNIVSPVSDSVFLNTNQFELIWNATDNAAGYQVLLGNDIELLDIVDSIVVEDTTLIFSNLSTGHYYWSVSCLNDSRRLGKMSSIQRTNLINETAGTIQFVEGPSNPVIMSSSILRQQRKIAPEVIYDEGLFKMWIGLIYDTFAYATSSDGANWSLVNTNVQIWTSGHFPEHPIWHPFVLKTGDSYVMFYSCVHGKHVVTALSDDGLSWRGGSGTPILNAGPTGSFDAAGVADCSVVWRDGTFHMWYTGIDESGNTAIGYATAPNYFTWTKSPNNPITISDNSIGLNPNSIRSPSVIYDSNINMYEMAYETRNINGNNSSISRAWSTDGVSWSSDNSNPVVLFGLSGDWNSSHSSYPSLIKIGNAYHLWFVGNNGGSSWNIGYASGASSPQVSPSNSSTSMKKPLPLQ